ncbi:MAG: hypothetical protein KAH77_07085 [Thiomargarita sp.]|nr:hypothetical protein [Thiomargarita sp.]
MIESIIAIAEIASTGYNSYQCLSNFIFGNKQEEYLKQISENTKKTNIKIERLSDQILYAVNAEGVRASNAKEQQYITNLDKDALFKILDPIQRAFQKPLLASSMISAPSQISTFDRHKLKDHSPLDHRFVQPFVDSPWEAILFKEKGAYWVGWQTPKHISQHLGCESVAQWTANQNVLPQSKSENQQDLTTNGTIFRDRLKDGTEGPYSSWDE